jgi:hypothetical protein
LTQLAAASNRGLLPSPSFAFDDVRTSPEELVNSASPKLALRFQRNRVNQPDPIFPQSPGIILKRTTLILPAAVHFVLSMNCNDSNRKFISAHKLICTVYSPKLRREQGVSNSFSPLFSTAPAKALVELFTGKIQKKSGGEQVSAGNFDFFSFSPDDSPRR